MRARTTLRRRLAAFSKSRAGNFATLTALTAPVALMLAAFAIDESALFLEKRRLQSLADLAAIAAVANPDDAERAVLAVLRDNGFGRTGKERDLPRIIDRPDFEGGTNGVMVTTGSYRADPSIGIAERFVPNGSPPNAARVTIRDTGTLYFSATFFEAPAISASAVAAARREAAFSIGSRLARLDGGIANAMLSGLTGSSISLTAMDYETLLSTDIGLLSVLDALDSRLALKATDYNEVLRATATAGDIAEALARVEGLDAAAKVAAGKLAARTNDTGGSIPLSRLFDIGGLGILPVGHSPAGSDPQLGVMRLISAAAVLSAANGRHQVELDLGTNIAGLAEVSLALAVGEPPQFSSWFAIGERGTVIRTAQTRLLLDIRIGAGGMLGHAISLPLYLELAAAEARLAGIACPSAGKPRVTIAARPGIARLQIGEVSVTELARFDRTPALAPALLVSTPIAKVQGSAEIEIAERASSSLRFGSIDIHRRAVKTVQTTDIAESLTDSLLEDLTLNVEMAGLGIGLPENLSRAVADTLRTATPAIDGLLAEILGTLGLSLGEADVRVHGATCGRAVLVQ
jgi:uncharacterized membrane protein